MVVNIDRGAQKPLILQNNALKFNNDFRPFQRELLRLLTDKELIAAKATFTMLDVDNDGHIKEYEAVQAYRNWYKRFEKQRKK